MSWWKILGGLGAVAAAPFTGGASLAALPVLSAANAADASKSAAATQSASADKAMALTKSEYEGQQQRLAPYAALGGQAFQTLAGLTLPKGTPLPGYGQMTAPQMAPGIGQQAMGQKPPSMGAMPDAMGQTVRVQGPDGSVRDVPRQKVAMGVPPGFTVLN